MIGEFKEWYKPENVKHFLEGNKEISAKKLHNVLDAASAASTGNPPITVDIDYQKCENPYNARYGGERLREVIRGTTHNYTWTFCHDALSLMSAKESCLHMGKTGILKRWIMPEEGLNKKEKYDGKLIGNCPEMNALDANLNKDIQDGVRCHISKTCKQPDDDKRKF
eukprot:14820725-Ditylum_brightwellii.AAC.2